MDTRSKFTSRSRIPALATVCAFLLGAIFAPSCAADEDYLSAIPEDVQACACALAWASGFRHMTHRDEQWDAREHAPRDTCHACGGAPMCVVCMEYDLESYDSRSGVPATLRECQRRVQSYLRTATRQETEFLATLYWTAYWDGRHNRSGEHQDDEAWHVVSGAATATGEIEFETPFILGVASLRVARIADYNSGEDLLPSGVTAEFVSYDEMPILLGPEDLQMVILCADGYASEVITDFAETKVDTSPGSPTHISPLEIDILLIPLTSQDEDKCKSCTVVLEINSDNGSTVKGRLLHCGEDGRWEQWRKGDWPRHKEAPPKECKTCTYWLQYEQVETRDQNNEPMSFGKYTLHHCNPDDTWQQVYVHTATKVSELPKGRCTPGHEVIVVTERQSGKKIYVRHDLYRCNSRGQWVRIGSWTEVKSS